MKSLRIQRANDIRKLMALNVLPLNAIDTPAILDAKGLARDIGKQAALKKANVSLVATDSISQALTVSLSGQHPTLLIFGSARRPGGGWDKGAVAQEEDVALHSTWGVQAEAAPVYYEMSKSDTATAINPDLLLWADNGLILADSLQTWLPSPVACSFVAFAAPNAKDLANQGFDTEHPSMQALFKHHMDVRCTATLVAATQQNTEHLILGAIGCGVFRLNPQLVANAWRRAITATKYTGDITFALPSGPESIIGIAFMEAFKQKFI